ncbi:GAF domain-containing protein [Egbenema bharatensis]|uniref:GAF domain-containing protein n=1 Tax=Egbenema bharatensis TaxID=3463334 RepID=UPI003A85595D
MTFFIASEDEEARLQALYHYRILDTETETVFDDLTQLAAQICDTPIALISLVDAHRLWFKARVGLDVSEIGRDLTLCNYAVQQAHPLIVQNASVDQRFAAAPLVLGEPYIRFYAGIPLVTPEGYGIGTLCVIDRIPRQLCSDQIKALEALSRQVISQLEMRRHLTWLQEREQQLQSILNAAPEGIESIPADGRLLGTNPAGLPIIQQTENALHQSLKELAEIKVALDQFSIVAITDAQGNITSVNDRFCEISQYSREELIGQSHRIVNPNHYPPSFFQDMCQTSAQGKVWRGEIKNRAKDGSFYWVDTTIVPFLDDHHQPYQYIALQTDVTARKQAETALQKQTERERLVAGIANRIRQSLDLNQILNTTVSEVQQLLQSDRVLTYRVTPYGTGRVTNEAVAPDYAPILGQSLPEVIFPKECHELYRQGRVRAITNIEQDEVAPCLVETLRKLGVQSKLVVPILHKEQLWGLLIVHHCRQPRQWQTWEIELLTHLSTQVAIAIHQSELYQQTQAELLERKQAEQKIRDQAALLDVATDAIVVQGLNRQITYWNKGAERLYGWAAREAMGQLEDKLLYREAPGNIEAIYQAVLSKGEWQGELYQWTKAEREVIVQSRWTLVRDSNGQPQAILMVNTNITQKKQLERQFLRAQRMESIGTLAGGIAHDLNNLLAPILMAVSLLEMQLADPEDPKGRQWIDIIDSSARRGASLVKQVLSFARGVEGERSLLEVKHLIWEIKQIAEETFPKSITLSTNIPRDLWIVCGDATQLHQILMNLCLNARDAMSNGGMIKISAENVELTEEFAQFHLEAHAGSYVKITVSDTGEGITPDVIDRIFDPFFTTKEMGKGTGLGLSTVMTIIKSHNGFITVSSQIHKGTEFQVYLPAIHQTEVQVTEAQNILIGHGELILLVDDETFIREVTKDLLETYGYEVLTAQDGIEAVTLFARHKADVRLVLIDMMMPSMDGKATIQTLRTMNPQIQIVAMSGLSTSGVNEPKTEVNASLSKPFTTQELLSTLQQVLQI